MGLVSFIKSMFIMLQTKNGILTRIEFLVITSGLLYLLMFFLDLRRHRSHSSTIKYTLIVLNGIADSMMLYVLGLMQSTPFKNELFLIWAVILVNLRYSADYISAHGLPDQTRSRFIEIGNLYACVWTANLNVSKAAIFKHPLWLLWSLQVLRILYNFLAYQLAKQSLWHGLNSLLLTESIKLEPCTPKGSTVETQNLSNLSNKKEMNGRQDLHKWHERNNNEEQISQVGTQTKKVFQLDQENTHEMTKIEAENHSELEPQEKIKSQETDVMPQEQTKPQQVAVMPRKQTKPEQANVIPRKQIKTQHANIVPQEQIKPQQADVVTSEQTKAQQVVVPREEQTKAQQVDVVPREQTETQKVNVVRRKQTKTHQADVAPQTPEQTISQEVDFTPEERTKHRQVNVSTKSRYNYFVRGETKQRMKVSTPDYLIYLKINRRNELITLDKIWECNKQLLGTSVFPNYDLKCLCLSFALYRLLRCRFDDLPIPEESIPQTQELIFEGIIGDKKGQNIFNGIQGVLDKDEQVFQIIEAELAFINDYYYTRNPLIFWEGFPFINVALMISTVSAIVWLGLDIRSIYKPLQNQYTHVVHKVNVDVAITWGFMILVLIKEFWEMATYIFSDWNKVVLICEYIGNPHLFRSAIAKNSVRFICNYRVVKQWHGEINMYNIMESFNYNPWKWNILYLVTLGLVSKRSEGEKPSTSIKLSREVKKAVAKALRSLRLDQKQKTMAGKTKTVKGRLSETMSDLLPDKVLGEQFKFSWSDQLVTYSHFILAWHVATCLCEIKLSKDHNTEKPNSILLRYAKYALSFLNCCPSPQPFLIKLENLEDDIRSHYAVANSISRYCAYLLISEPELLPDQFFVPQLIFEKTISDAREALHGCNSLEEMYDQLINKAKKGKSAAQAESMTIVQMGAELGCRLVEMKDLDLWNALAELWAKLLVYMAPSWNVAAHKKCLETGGEFITQIWAVLSHVGIDETTEIQQPKISGQNLA